MLSFASQYFLVSYKGGRGGGYYDDGGGGGGGGGIGGKAWRRERRKKGCPSPRWQPSASRVQGRIINLFQRFLHSQKTKGIGESSVHPVAGASSSRMNERAIACPRQSDKVSLRFWNGTFFFMQDYGNKEKKDNALIDFAAARNFLTDFESRRTCRVSEGTLPARLPVLRNDQMNQIWRYINAPNYAAC
ncbi:hypothetical protein ALC57_14140 [Trachymyrmex cornetzi]|uniref:Uncharacterized protein n=1 Tax=Trachymyrmex cornetzi TaxID=471704 RepID=A0A151IYR0_9HYME|nr:hypothetical protein ALC57_14140 [Trachymyrmex cornetzi]